MKSFVINNSITNRDGLTIEKYFNEVSRVKLLSKQEEADLAKRIREGDQEALNKLIKANLRFVVSVAKQYQYLNVPLNDLINEGNLGLIKAAKMFDETKGFKFISYAVFWIRQMIMESLTKNGRQVRIPSNKLDELAKINKASQVMQQMYEREPTQEELAEYLGVKPDDIRTVEEASIKQSSLDAPFNDDDAGSLLDVIEDPDSVIPGEDESLKFEMDKLLAMLSEKEQSVLKKVFGIGTGYSVSMDDIAEDLNMSRERVRQIKEVALRKLRLKKGSRVLQSFLS